MLYNLLNDAQTTQHISYVEKWCKDSDLNIDDFMDYLVIRIVPKEKKLKIAFRGFDCKCNKERMCNVIQERNMAMMLEEYYTEQEVTLSELEVFKKLLAFRRIREAYKGYTSLYMAIDATGWNSFEREEAINLIMEKIADPLQRT